MTKDTSFSEIPFNYGLCAADCPRGDTCLRRIAYDHIPADVTFPPTLHPKAIEAMASQEILSEAERRNVAVAGRAAAGGCACQEVRRAVGRIL